MKNVKIGIIGFGNVGQGFAQAILQKRELLRETYGINPLITAISDAFKGSLYCADGLDLRLLAKPGVDFAEFEPEVKVNWDASEMIASAESDVILELTVVNLQTGEPAVSYITQALQAGKSVITSNKGPIALKYRSLNALAQQNNVKLGIEGTVMSGTPAIRLGKEILESSGIQSIRGILNGTCNFILTEMKNGATFSDALASAQNLGYAEADPTNDVGGFDTAAKVSILSEVFFGERVVPADIPCEGISDLTPQDIEKAAEEKSVWKLLGTIDGSTLPPKISVKPVMLPESDPLAGVNGAMNAIQYQTELLGQVTLIGAGAGRLETAAGLIQDLILFFKEK